MLIKITDGTIIHYLDGFESDTGEPILVFFKKNARVYNEFTVKIAEKNLLASKKICWLNNPVIEIVEK